MIAYMKNYSYLWTISYDVIILISYSKGQGSKLSIFKGLVLWGVRIETLALPSLRLSLLLSSSKLRVISVIPFNLFVLVT